MYFSEVLLEEMAALWLGVSLLFLSLIVYTGGFVHIFMWPPKPGTLNSPGIGVTGNCVASAMGAGRQTRVLCYNHRLSWGTISLALLLFDLFYYFIFTLSRGFVCVHICAPRVFLVSTEFLRGCWIPWNWTYQLLWAVMWVLVIGPKSSAWAASARDRGAIFLIPVVLKAKRERTLSCATTDQKSQRLRFTSKLKHTGSKPTSDLRVKILSLLFTDHWTWGVSLQRPFFCNYTTLEPFAQGYIR